MDLRDVHYDAFISYRHKEVDQFAAVNLHKKLEAFRLPKNVQSKVTNGHTKIERVFRDEEELPLANNLSDPIGTALSNSDFLIVICTPRLKESRWCLKEIDTFLETHERRNLLVVLAEGEPEESFPYSITHEEVVTTDEAGNEVRTVREIEPLAADVRGATKKEVLKNMDIAVLKLAAAMFGLNFDDLKQRHREQRMRRMMQLTAVVSAVILVFAVWSFVTLMKISAQNREIEAQNRTIEGQYKELNDKFAGSMAEASGQLLGVGRLKDAVYAVRSVLPDNEEDGFHAGAYRALNAALDPYGVSGLYVPEEFCSFSSSVVEFAISADESRIAAFTGDGMLAVQEAGSGETLFSREQYSESGYEHTFAFCGNDFIVFDQGGETLICSLGGDTGSGVGSKSEGGSESDAGSKAGGNIGRNTVDNSGSGAARTLFGEEAQLIQDGQGKITFAWLEGQQLLYAIAADGSIAWQMDVPGELNDGEASFMELQPSADGKCFTAVFWGDRGSSVLAADTESGAVRLSFLLPNQFDASAVTDGKTVYAACWYGQDSSSTALVTAMDMATGKKLWQNSALSELGSLRFIGSHLCLESGYQLVSLDAANGESIFSYSDGRLLCGAAELDGRLWFAESDGTTCTGDDGYMTEGRLLNTVPAERISVFEAHEDKLYILYNGASHIARYAKQSSKGTAAEKAGYEESSKGTEAEKTDYEEKLHYGGYADDRLEALGIVTGQVKDCFLSDDENVIFLQGIDGTISFYSAQDKDNDEVKDKGSDKVKDDVKDEGSDKGSDKGNGDGNDRGNGNAPINTLYDETIVPRSLTFYDDIGCWVLNGYNSALIMNAQFEVLAETCACAGTEDGCLILNPEEETFVKVPFVTYGELISRADSLLNGYKPQESVQRRYNLL